MYLLNDLAARRIAAWRGLPAEKMGVSIIQAPCGAWLFDCGVAAAGGLEAGRQLAEICLADLGTVAFAPSPTEIWPGIAVTVATDSPVRACMASQYAGWQIAVGKYFAMGSGPMRAAAGKEKLFDQIGNREQPAQAVGVLETDKLPSDEACRKIAEDCRVSPENLTLLIARTASLAGTVQIVARTVETALHKLHELGFDLGRIRSGFGVAPLPPVAADDLTGIGRTNDAVLYGGEVTLWLTGDDAELSQLGPQVPSSASRDYGEPFAAIFEHYHRDFYKIDPLLFSPAVVNFVNVQTGKLHRFGQFRPDLLRRSFAPGAPS